MKPSPSTNCLFLCKSEEDSTFPFGPISGERTLDILGLAPAASSEAVEIGEEIIGKLVGEEASLDSPRNG